MLTNALKLSSVILLVTLSMAKADTICANDISEDACKMEWMKRMNMKVMEKHMETMKMTMTKMMEMLNTMMKDMPADNPHMMMMKSAVDAMKTDMEMMGKMKDMTDRMKIQEMIEKMYKDMTYKCENKDDEICKKMMMMGMMEMKKENIMKMMMAFENIWTMMYAGLREKDMKKYPMYMEMNEMMNTMKATKEPEEKAKMMMSMMTKMMKFQEVPYMKAMLMAMCHNCEM